MYGPILHGERLTLGPPKPDYVPTYIRWMEDADVTHWTLFRGAPSLKMEEEWLENTARAKDTLYWAVTLGDRLIGSVGIHQIDWVNRNGMTGTLFGEKDCWGKGYATEAIALRTRFAFDQLGLEKLSTHVAMPNIGSRRALEKNGYRTVGIARHDWWRDGGWVDCWIAEVLRDDWLASQS